jgi:deoxyribodipyrimidine photolyase
MCIFRGWFQYSKWQLHLSILSQSSVLLSVFCGQKDAKDIHKEMFYIYIYIYYFNKFNKLIEEQKHTKESKNQRNMFDLIIQHQKTPTLTPQTQEV